MNRGRQIFKHCFIFKSRLCNTRHIAGCGIVFLILQTVSIGKMRVFGTKLRCFFIHLCHKVRHRTEKMGRQRICSLVCTGNRYRIHDIIQRHLLAVFKIYAGAADNKVVIAVVGHGDYFAVIGNGLSSNKQRDKFCKRRRINLFIRTLFIHHSACIHINHIYILCRNLGHRLYYIALSHAERTTAYYKY